MALLERKCELRAQALPRPACLPSASRFWLVDDGERTGTSGVSRWEGCCPRDTTQSCVWSCRCSGEMWLGPWCWSQEPRVLSFLRRVALPFLNHFEFPPNTFSGLHSCPVLSLYPLGANKRTLTLSHQSKRTHQGPRALWAWRCTSAPGSGAGTSSQTFSDVIVYGHSCH